MITLCLLLKKQTSKKQSNISAAWYCNLLLTTNISHFIYLIGIFLSSTELIIRVMIKIRLVCCKSVVESMQTNRSITPKNKTFVC